MRQATTMERKKMTTYEERLATFKTRQAQSYKGWEAWARNHTKDEVWSKAQQRATYEVSRKLGKQYLVDIIVESEVGREPRPPRKTDADVNALLARVLGMD